MKKLKPASSPKKPVASVGKVVSITETPHWFSDCMLHITQKILGTHWANFTDVEIVQLMTLRRAISAKLVERMGGV